MGSRALPTAPGGPWVARGVAAVVALSVAGGLYADHSSGYHVRVSLESATNVVKGAPVLVDGFASGKVGDIEVQDGHALLTLDLDKDVAPLHDGATVVVGWKAALSERLVEVTDGPAGHAEVPDGGQLPGTMAAPTEVSDVLNSLDAPTRQHLQSLLAEAGQTLGGNEPDLNATLRNGGPTLGELGRLLRALGTDGPAMRDLVTRVNAMMTTIGGRDDKVSQVVFALSRLTRQVARRRTSLRAGLAALPGTLRQASTTLGDVPSTVDAVDPLLRDLTPATARLGSVSRDL
ncbi:MAG TPA: MlaD family protein, partial [Nocardioides sp.]|nr:MlaD family protein [Nocardioides sp.]